MLHSLSKERLELVNSLEPYVRERVMPLLKPVEKCWQPADFLPDPSKGDYLDQVCIRLLCITLLSLKLRCLMQVRGG